MPKPHELDPYLVEAIARRGGLAVNGKPLFRIIWSQDVQEVRGQLWKDRDASGNIIREIVEYRKVPKYFFDRWVFEMWTPVNMSEAEWNYEYTEFFDGLPFLKLPYPHDGEYELVKVLETPCSCREANGNKAKYCSRPREHRQFVPITHTIADCLIMTASQNRHIPAARRLAMAQERRAHEEKRRDENAIDILREQLGPMKGNPYVSVL